MTSIAPPPEKRLKLSSESAVNRQGTMTCYDCKQSKDRLDCFSANQQRKGEYSRCRSCVDKTQCSGKNKSNSNGIGKNFRYCSKCEQRMKLKSFAPDQREVPDVKRICKQCFANLEFKCSKCQNNKRRPLLHRLPPDARPETAPKDLTCRSCFLKTEFKCTKCLKNKERTLFDKLSHHAKPETAPKDLTCKSCFTEHATRPRACVQCQEVKPKADFLEQVWGTRNRPDCDDESKLVCKTCLPQKLLDIQECAKFHQTGIDFYKYPEMERLEQSDVKAEEVPSLVGQYSIFYLFNCFNGEISSQRKVKGLLTVAPDTESDETLVTVQMEQVVKEGVIEEDHISNLDFQMAASEGSGELLLELHDIQSQGYLKDTYMDGDEPCEDFEITGSFRRVKQRFPMPGLLCEDKDDSVEWFESVAAAEEALQKQRSPPKWMVQLAAKNNNNDDNMLRLDHSIASKVWDFVREEPPSCLFLEPGDLILDVDWTGGDFHEQGDYMLVARKKADP